MTRQLRVLHCVPSLNATDGGPARSVPALAGAEANAGVDVRVWSCQPPTIDLTPFQPAGFVTGELKSVVTEQWTPDIIHDHGLWLPSNHASARLGRHRRIPRCISPKGMLQPWCLRHRRFRKLAAWQLYQHRDLLSSACLRASSESEAEQLCRLGFEQKVVTVPNGVTLPKTPLSRDDNHDTEQTIIREVLFLSRIHPVKGLPHLIEAWQRVVRPGWRLRIVGPDEGGHLAEIRNLINRKQLHNSVAICDAVLSEEKWTLLRDADLVVLPSFSENFGVVVTEALAVGTPVVTTTGTPWKDLVSERCGWYVAPSADGIATALSDAMNQSPEARTKMGERGREWVLKTYSWTDIGQRMVAVYQRLLRDTPSIMWPAGEPTHLRRAA